MICMSELEKYKKLGKISTILSNIWRKYLQKFATKI